MTAVFWITPSSILALTQAARIAIQAQTTSDAATVNCVANEKFRQVSRVRSDQIMIFYLKIFASSTFDLVRIPRAHAMGI